MAPHMSSRAAGFAAVGGGVVLYVVLRWWRQEENKLPEESTGIVPHARELARQVSVAWDKVAMLAFRKPPVSFVRLADLEAHGSFPRCGSDPEFVHKKTGLANSNLQRPADSFDEMRTVFVFCSHRWIRPGDSESGHPDDAANSKYEIVLAALRALQRGPASPVPHHFEVAVWVDFCCIDQDVAPGDELCAQLDQLLRTCDLVLTPVVDALHATWQYPTSVDPARWFEAYQAEAWNEYWRRAWCRVEAMLGAAYPVEDCEARAKRFRGGLRNALLAGRRPHLLYGDKERAEGRAPIFLAPLLHGTFARYRPEDGELTKRAQDLPLIIMLERRARTRWPELRVGFVAGYPYVGGSGGGRGKRVHEDGSSYEGEWRDGQPEGHGCSVASDGTVYEGEWRGGQQHGHGRMAFASGAVYEGDWMEGKRHGRGRDEWADGGVYEGEFSGGMRHGRGRHTFANGDVYDGEWRHRKRHGRGREVRADGKVVLGEWRDGGLIPEGGG